jgi:excisionase family DNA binding protein
MNTEERVVKLLQAPANVQAAIDDILEGKVAKPTEAKPSAPLLMGMGAAAKFLGVGRTTLWRMTRAGRLKKVEVLEGSFRIRRADLEAIAARRRA